MVAGNSPPNLEAALHEIETLKHELAKQRRQFEFELKLLDLALANVFDLLKAMDSKGDIAVACALARENVAMLIETATKKFGDKDESFTDG
jgi:hypothetical protein